MEDYRQGLMHFLNPLRFLGLPLLFVLLSGCGETPPESTTLPFLEHTWNEYKQTFIHPEGYVWDEHREEVTSEGQSYALLRAVWMRDQTTFDKVLAWTEQTLLRQDGLHMWQWHPEKGILDPNTATDADQDIAFALILAADAFGQPEHLLRARRILQAIHSALALPLENSWFPAAGDWAVYDRIVNLSYFTPYAYPYFDRVHPEGGWMGVRESGYRLLERSRRVSPVGLIPDFLRIDMAGTPLPLYEHSTLSKEYSFDAMRIHWRVAMDCMLHTRSCANDPSGAKYMARLLKRDRALWTRYGLNGVPLSRTQSPSFYGSVLPALERISPAMARYLLEHKLSAEQLAPILDDPDRYYDLNWIWFGLAASGGTILERTPPPAQIKPAS